MMIRFLSSLVALLTSILLLTACAGFNSNNATSTTTVDIDATTNYRLISSTPLDSDGPAGDSAYQLIEAKFGQGAIESPDLYGSENHQGKAHIIEGYDQQVGNHFIFTLHRDIDRERNKTEINDRQRNEIKVYDKSDDALKGFKDTTFEYRWKFKMADHFKVSEKFTHLFQLKAVGQGVINTPIVTITANSRKGKEGLEVRHSSSTQKRTLAHTGLAGVEWQKLQGQWLEVFVRANYRQHGSLELTITAVSQQTPLVTIAEYDIDMWRAGAASGNKNFVRPKWGIYRSLLKAEKLNPKEQVSFANFQVRKVQAIQ